MCAIVVDHIDSQRVKEETRHFFVFVRDMNIVSPFKSSCLSGRVALITGGGSGIGFGIAEELGKHGCAIVIMGRRENVLQKAASILESHGVRASYCKGDVRSETDARRAVDHAVRTFGGLDVLVNSAAGNFLCQASDLKPKGFRTVMEIDALGVWNMCHASFESLKRSGRGVIINISATLHLGATWYQAHACAAKAAIDSVTRSLGLEWGTYNIRTIGIAPGPIAGTPGVAKLAPAAQKMVSKLVPLERMGETSEIGLAAVFLTSDAAKYITGTTIIVDGGEWLFKPPPIPRDAVAALSKRVEAKSRAIGPKSSRL